MVETAPQSWAVEGRCHRPKLPNILANSMIVICQAVAKISLLPVPEPEQPLSGG